MVIANSHVNLYMNYWDGNIWHLSENKRLKAWNITFAWFDILFLGLSSFSETLK